MTTPFLEKESWNWGDSLTVSEIPSIVIMKESTAGTGRCEAGAESPCILTQKLEEVHSPLIVILCGILSTETFKA